jgi:peptide/nickel transport system permease protein
VARHGQAALLLLMVSAITFALLRATPGDPGVLIYGPNVSLEELAQVRARWGLDAPLHLQYLRWVANAATGDFGRSYVDGRAVLAVVGERVPATLLLGGTALLLSTLLGVALGVLSASRRRSRTDRAATLLSTLFYSTPPFWLGLLLILLFSTQLGWLPSGGMRTAGATTEAGDLLRHLVLPAVALALRDAGRVARLTRVSMLEVLAQDYLRTAAAKGLDRSTIALRHVLRNALLPILALLGTSIPGLLGGVVVVETVFGWPGMGRLVIDSSLQRNYPVIMGEVMIVALLALAGSLLADLACAAADPRLRSGPGG